jgi:protein-disulfide isomerase
MKIVIAVALAVIVGCAHPQPAPTTPAGRASPAAGAAGSDEAPGEAPGGAPGGVKIDRSGSLAAQLARLQDAHDRDAEAIAFLSRIYAQQKAQPAARDDDELAADGVYAVDVTADIAAGQVDGPADAPVTIIKAFDFACPYCQRTVALMKELLADYHGKVRVVYTNMVIHPLARPAHLASCAAARQGKYKQFKDAFWDKGFAPYLASSGRDASSLGEDSMLAIAKGLGLDTVKFKTDMSSRECEDRLAGDMAELAKFRVDSTPTFFINGKHISGAQAREDFVKIIDEQLRIAEASGVRGADYYTKVVLARGEKQFRSSKDPRSPGPPGPPGPR